MALPISEAFYKLGLVVGGLLIAAAITACPLTHGDHFTRAANSVYGMWAIMWAPAALIIGIGIAVALWPRKHKHPRSRPTSANGATPCRGPVGNRGRRSGRQAQVSVVM